MLIVDDPLLALILRFVVDTDEAGPTNEEFLRRQILTLRQYVAQFPEQEQGEKAMQWIERHAEGYRRSWQNRTVSQRTVHLRCADCPLTERGAAEHCEIHEQWLYLLRRYIAGQIRTRPYVEESLRLLREHKARLKRRGAASQPNEALSHEKPKKKKQKDKEKNLRKRKKRKKTKLSSKAQDVDASTAGASPIRPKAR
jgi:hypothetical protein